MTARLQMGFSKTILLVFVSLLSVGAMTEETFTTLDDELAQDWILERLEEATSSKKLVKSISDLLANNSLQDDVVTENDIDEAIADEIEGIEEYYRQGDLDLTEEEYQEELEKIRNQNRDEVRKELIELGDNINFSDRVATCELLSALLGKPTMAFESMMDNYPERYKRKFLGINKDVNRLRLKEYVHYCIEFLTHAELYIDFEKMGLYEKPEQDSYRMSIIELREKLKTI